jgi:hypothetical protein
MPTALVYLWVQSLQTKRTPVFLWYQQEIYLKITAPLISYLFIYLFYNIYINIYKMLILILKICIYIIIFLTAFV